MLGLQIFLLGLIVASSLLVRAVHGENSCSLERGSAVCSRNLHQLKLDVSITTVHFEDDEPTSAYYLNFQIHRLDLESPASDIPVEIKTTRPEDTVEVRLLDETSGDWSTLTLNSSQSIRLKTNFEGNAYFVIPFGQDFNVPLIECSTPFLIRQVFAADSTALDALSSLNETDLMEIYSDISQKNAKKAVKAIQELTTTKKASLFKKVPRAIFKSVKNLFKRLGLSLVRLFQFNRVPSVSWALKAQASVTDPILEFCLVNIHSMNSSQLDTILSRFDTGLRDQLQSLIDAIDYKTSSELPYNLLADIAVSNIDKMRFLNDLKDLEKLENLVNSIELNTDEIVAFKNEINSLIPGRMTRSLVTSSLKLVSLMIDSLKAAKNGLVANQKDLVTTISILGLLLNLPVYVPVISNLYYQHSRDLVLIDFITFPVFSRSAMTLKGIKGVDLGRLDESKPAGPLKKAIREASKLLKAIIAQASVYMSKVYVATRGTAIILVGALVLALALGVLVSVAVVAAVGVVSFIASKYIERGLIYIGHLLTGRPTASSTTLVVPTI